MPRSSHWRFLRTPVPCGFALLAFLLSGCGVSGAPLSVSIAPLADEDISAPCRFDLSFAHPQAKQNGVLVLYERGDTDKLYNDTTLRNFVGQLDYSLLWVHQCNAQSTGDLQADAAKGPARMLFSALDELAAQTNHPELATASLIVYGFSAAGVLTATLTNNHPDRLLGAIQYAAGSAHTDLDDVPVTLTAARIPTLILANANDSLSGTERNLAYFQRGRQLGAAWAYGVQNSTGHCCNLSTRSIILPWIQDIAHLPAQRIATADANATVANFICTPDGVEDSQKHVDCKFTLASLGGQSSALEESGWLPSQASGAAWLAWVTSLTTN